MVLAYKQPSKLDEVYVGIHLLFSLWKTRAQNNLLEQSARPLTKEMELGKSVNEWQRSG